MYTIYAESSGTGNLRCGKLGKDPSVETNFLPDSEREAEEQAERERLKKQWLREQEQIKSCPFSSYLLISVVILDSRKIV
jgi:hypothetical protein